MDAFMASFVKSVADGAPSVTSRTDGLKSSPLDELPVELIDSIASMLPTESKAALALTCRPLHDTLSGAHWGELRRYKPAKLEFLLALARDKLSQIACFECKKIHNLDNVSRYYRGTKVGRNLLPCQRADYVSKFGLRMHPRFSRAIFQHVMTQYRRDNPDDLPYSTYSEVPQLSHPATTEESHTFRSSARIIDGSLILRTSWIFELETSLFSESEIPKLPLCLPRVYLCEHAETVDSLYIHQYLASLETTKDQDGLHTTSYHLRSCKFCKTEHRIDFKNYGKKFGKKQIAMLITKWENLGSGPTHSERWQPEHKRISFAPNILLSHTAQEFGNLPLMEYKPVSICEAFEGHDISQFEFASVLDAKSQKQLFQPKPLGQKKTTASWEFFCSMDWEIINRHMNNAEDVAGSCRCEQRLLSTGDGLRSLFSNMTLHSNCRRPQVKWKACPCGRATNHNDHGLSISAYGTGDLLDIFGFRR